MAAELNPTVLRHRDRLQSLKFSTIEACFSVPMLNLTMPNLPFVIAFVLVALGWSPAWVGLLAALPQIGNAIQPWLSGWLQRRYSHRVIMYRSFVVSGLPWLLMPFLRWLPEWRDAFAIVLVTISTLANSVASVAWSASIAELVPPRISGKYFARRNLIFGFWTLVAVLAAGFTVDAGDHGFDVFAGIFFIAGLARLMGLYYLSRMIFPPSADVVQKGGATIEQARSVFADRNYIRFTLFIGLWGFFLGMGLPFQTVFLIDVLHFPMSEVVVLSTLAGIGGLITLKGWGSLCDRFGNKPVLYVCSLIWALVGLLTWCSAGPRFQGHLTVAFIVIGGLTAGFQLCQFNLMLKLIAAERRAAHIAVFLALTSALLALGPLVGGALLAWFPSNAGEIMGHPVLNYHLLFCVSMVGCLMLPGLLQSVREDAEAPAIQVWRAMRAMRSFNPLVGVASAAEFLFTPRGLTGLARQSWRSLRRNVRAVSEVGEDIVEVSKTMARETVEKVDRMG